MGYSTIKWVGNKLIMLCFRTKYLTNMSNAPIRVVVQNSVLLKIISFFYTDTMMILKADL